MGSAESQQQQQSGTIEIKRLEDCTFKQAVELWNGGFSGYYSDMSTTMEKFVPRLGQESIRPDLSVAAFVDGQPAGFVLVAKKTVGGVDIAWNGGTGVSPQFRGKGLAKLLMQEAVKSMRESGAATGLLEVVQKNAGAIAAYKSAGFEIRDGLIGARASGPLSGVPEASDSYRIETVKPHQLVHLPFFRHEAAWSSTWYNLRDADGIVVYDKSGAASAYAIARRSRDDSGKLTAASLYQCEADPAHSEHKELVASAMAAAFGPLAEPISRSTANLSMSDPAVVEWLEAAKFETQYTQYLMVVNLKEE
ncbi:MAG: hypothetical protein K0Q59_791 [Paenibacillus sp.]|jgi:ribosomal protein S18 acetylase RimI-like enzyme|nr:hypothetical protein [Paenibacillus sp.]